jgi:hypothetical protein
VKEFKASEVASLINNRSSEHGAALKDFYFPGASEKHAAIIVPAIEQPLLPHLALHFSCSCNQSTAIGR